MWRNDTNGDATHAVYVWEDHGRQQDRMLSTLAVECAKTQIKCALATEWYSSPAIL